MSLASRTPYPLGMDDKVYTTIGGQPMTEAEFAVWADKFADDWANRPDDEHAELWRRAITAPRHTNIPTETVSVEFAKPLLDAIDGQAAKAGFTRDQFIELALLAYLAE